LQGKLTFEVHKYVVKLEPGDVHVLHTITVCDGEPPAVWA